MARYIIQRTRCGKFDVVDLGAPVRLVAAELKQIEAEALAKALNDAETKSR